MLILTSAAYVPAELVSELGQLPPSFLPLGNRRLYVRQLATLAGLRESILMSLPADFELEAQDAAALQAAGVKLVRTDAGCSLARSLLKILEEHPPQAGESVRILHGDTLQGDLPLGQADVVAVAANDGYYPRAYVVANGGRLGSADYRYCQPGDPVLTGYMSFADADRFRSLLGEGLGFIAVVNRYQAETGGALRIYRTRSWADCGHVNAYYRSRSTHTTERVFNELRVERHYIRKRGENAQKIRAELEWFWSLPPAMRHYAPQIGSYGTDSTDTYYDVEYLYSLPLSDLYVFGRLPAEDWGAIFVRCVEFLSECSAYGLPSTQRLDWQPMYLPKTLRRLEDFTRNSGWRLEQATTINGFSLPSLRAIAESAQKVIDAAPASPLTFCHGDFCFSNILYDARARRIKVIDPRGLDPHGQPSPYGDLRYDFGKLFHSVIGGYDFVMAGLLTAEAGGANTLRTKGELPDRTAPLIERFRQICLSSVGEAGGETLIAAITVHLFLSMLPLHHDEPRRQLALLGQALDLYRRYQFD